MWQQQELASVLESDIGDTVYIHCIEVACWFQCWKISTRLFFIGLIALVLLMWKWMGLFLRKIHSLRYWGGLSILNWIRAPKFFLLLKLVPRKLEPRFVLLSFFLLMLPCISLTVPDDDACNADVMPWLVLLVPEKQIYRAVGHLFAASLGPLAHCSNSLAHCRNTSVFCDTYGLKCLIKESICYKDPKNPSCIGIILTKNPKYFQSSCAADTDLSDFHRMTGTVMKTTFKKFQPRTIRYRD